MITMSTTYTPPTASTSVSDVYPGGVTLALGTEAVGFNPPQAGQSFVAADRFKGKTSDGADSRIVTAKKDNPADSSPRVIVEIAA